MSELRLTVTEAASPAELVLTLTLTAADGAQLPGFEAGAHLKVRVPDGSERHYSLVNLDPAPGATRAPAAYRLGVRLDEAGKGGSRYMHGLKPGDVVTAEGPRNDFRLADTDAPALLIAGGIGVTPIASMAAELTAAGRPFTFHYSGRTRGAMAFLDELSALCDRALVLHCDDEAGRFADLRGPIGAASRDSHIYVCGPRAMIEAAREIAHARGFARDHVHFELFDAPTAAGGDRAFEVELKSTGQVFTIPPGKSIIQVLEAGGVDLVYDCQRGDCGICQTMVLDGVPDHRDVILTDDERATNDVMQICVSRAKTARLVLDL